MGEGVAIVKVIVTIPWGTRLGGAETMLFGFLRTVDRSRIALTAVFFEDGPFVREVSALGIPTVVLHAGRLRHVRRGVRVVRDLARLLRREQPDLLLNWMAKTHLYGATAAMLAGRRTRVVWWQHTLVRRHWLERLATLLPATAVGCSSRHAARVQAEQRPLRSTFVVHPGIEAPPRSREDDLRTCRRGLAIPEERLLVGMVGRIEPGKEHGRFLELIAALCRRGLDVHGLIVGGPLPGSSPRLMSSLKQEARRRALDDRVTFTGQVADARPLIELMDVLVSVASAESFGIALVEAMALGVPVVAVEGGGPQEIIEPGRSGILVPPSRLADVVARTLTEGDVRQRLSAGGEERFRSRFTTARMARELEAAMTEVCTR